MLKLKNVSKYYYQDGVVASGFTKVNLELHLGEFVVITGESGSGKSTLLNVLSGLDSYEDGELYINGEETSHYTEEDYLAYRRKYVSNIFQNFNLVSSYTVYENIELALLMNGKKKKDIKKKVLELINQVDLKKFKHTKVAKLSGGQKQRVAIARALASDTPIIVADEPTGALDSKASREIIELLHQISQDKLVIIVTHNKEEIEKYATRLIRMHDGKILEDKVVTKINKDADLKEIGARDINFFSKVWLGIKNSFNIPIKFILMFIIFTLISLTLTSFYAVFRQSEDESIDTAYNYYFENISDKRIIIKKDNQESFTEEDYLKINNIKNIAYVVRNDLLNDAFINLESDYLYLAASPYLDELVEVSVGRMPQNAKEIVLVGSEDNWYFEDVSELLGLTLTLEETKDTVTVVGLLYEDNVNNYGLQIYCDKSILNNIEIYTNRNSSDIYYVLNNNRINDLDIKISDKVMDNIVYIPDSLSGYCPNSYCLNKYLQVNISNLYTNNSYDLLIGKTYNQDNYNLLTGFKKEDYIDSVVMNKNTYDALFNSSNYQSSVFVTDVRYLDEVEDELKNAGFVTFNMKDSKVDELHIIHQILNIFKLILGVILVVALFFITYFIIKIIYKARNSYYTTLRTLGGTKQVCTKILMYELINLASISYLIFLGLIYLVKIKLINIDYLFKLSTYVSPFEYFIVYVIIILLSILISYRYGEKIFKKSVIKSYGEKL